MRKRIAEIIELFGPHEIIALAAFLTTVFVWGVTLRAMYG